MLEELRDLGAPVCVPNVPAERIARRPLRPELRLGAAVRVALKGLGRMGDLAVEHIDADARRVDADVAEARARQAEGGAVELDKAAPFEAEGDHRHARRVPPGHLAVAAQGEEQVLQAVARMHLEHSAAAHMRLAKPAERVGGLPVGGRLGARTRGCARLATREDQERRVVRSGELHAALDVVEHGGELAVLEGLEEPRVLALDIGARMRSAGVDGVPGDHDEMRRRGPLGRDWSVERAQAVSLCARGCMLLGHRAAAHKRRREQQQGEYRTDGEDHDIAPPDRELVPSAHDVGRCVHTPMPCPLFFREGL